MEQELYEQLKEEISENKELNEENIKNLKEKYGEKLLSQFIIENEQNEEKEELQQNNNENYSNDLLRDYLKNIGEIPLLTIEEEIKYSKIVKKYNKFIEENNITLASLEKDLINFPNLNSKEYKNIFKNNFKLTNENINKITKLFNKMIGDTNDINILDLQKKLNIYNEYNKARKKMIEGNLRLVVSIAKRYYGSIEFEDLIQYGNIGLIKAIEEFNPDLGFKFSTYATWWIRQSITREIDNTRSIIRIPVHQREKIKNLHIAQKNFIEENGYAPSPNELSEILKLDPKEIEKMEIESATAVSLDTPIKNGEDEDSTLATFIADDTGISPEENSFNISLHDEIMKNIFSNLSTREKIVIACRMGFDIKEILNEFEYEEIKEKIIACQTENTVENYRPYLTLEQVGKILNVTRERVRQIESKALRKVKCKKYSGTLRNYIKD